MSTYSPVGPFTLTTDEDTVALAPEVADETIDALPLLDARQLSKTIAPYLALRGHYLALGDGSESRLLRVDHDVTHLGRGSAAEIRFDDYRVSRDHAILVRHGSRIRLLDNRSANGTFVNGRRIAATNIVPGDVIDLGPVRIQLIEVR
jgi:pSer/pThr/pTyr-binding forkhead associated (FHA) protein